MPMINAEVIKAVQELLHDRGIEQKEGERLGDYMGRGLGVSGAEAEEFIESLHQGKSVEQAQAELGIDAGKETLLKEIARVIGSTLGKLSKNATA